MSGGQPDPIRRIVVGVDGSDGAVRAVVWLARLARATGAEVVAAHAGRSR
jgi:nucleotide-binding universal stress UspA family protein